MKCELATYQAACKRWPRKAITLRQGGHIIEDNQPARDPPRQGRSCGRLGAGVGSDRLGSGSATSSAVPSITFFAASPARAASISHNASGAASNCSSDIALTPLEGSTFISFGTSIAHIFRYAAGCSFVNLRYDFCLPLEMLGEREHNRLLGIPSNYPVVTSAVAENDVRYVVHSGGVANGAPERWSSTHTCRCSSPLARPATALTACRLATTSPSRRARVQRQR